MPRGVQVGPRLQTWIALFLGTAYQIHCTVASLRIEGLQKSRRVQIVAGSHQHVIPDDHRRRRRKILLVKTGDFLMPALLSGAGIQADQVIVRRLHVKPVAPHADPAIADVCAALGLPEEVPQFAAIEGVHRPGVIGVLT